MIINSRSINKWHGKTADFHSLTHSSSFCSSSLASLHSFHFWLNNGHFSGFHHTGENVVQTLSPFPLKITCWRGGERNNKGRSENGFSTVVAVIVWRSPSRQWNRQQQTEDLCLSSTFSLSLLWSPPPFIHLFLSFREFFRRLQQQRRLLLLLPLFLYNRLEKLRLPLLFFVCKRANPTRAAAADQVLPPRVISHLQLFCISEIIINSSEVIIILKQEKFCSEEDSKFSAASASARSCHLCVGCPRFFVAAALFSLLVVFAFLIWFSSSLKLWRPRPFVSPLDKPSLSEEDHLTRAQAEEERRG